MKKPQVKIVEVGLRDGLQNEKSVLTIEQRYDLLEGLIKGGLQQIEIGAFVSPEWVPQMAGTADLIRLYQSKKAPAERKKISATVLVPNEKGMKQAIESKVQEVAVFISATESFSQKNINCSISESLDRVKTIITLAKKNKIKVRGYLSVCFGCPYEGEVSEKKVVELATKLFKMGCYEVSIGDTIGIANPVQVTRLFKKLKLKIPKNKLAGHFHDTRGMALANIWASYLTGITTFDSSIGGLGGCPYAKGASGNVSTEDVVNMFEQCHVKTNIKLDQLINVNHWLSLQMNKSLESKVSKVKSE